MDLNTISLIVTGVIALIIVVSIIAGIIQGFKNSLTSGIFNIVLVIVLLIFTNMITGVLINADLSGLNIVIEGEKLTSINQLIINMLQQEPSIAQMLQSSPETVTLITSLPVLIASPFVFTILFWAIKLIAFIISLIGGLISLIVKPFKKKKKQLDANGNPIKLPKKSKKRLLGGLIGAVAGLVIVFATFMPVFGVASVFNKLNEIKVDDAGNLVVTNSATLYADDETIASKTLLVEMLGEEGKKYLDAYNNCIGINIARFTGMEALGSTAFNNLASTKIEGEKIKLVDEVNSVVKIYKDYLTVNDLLLLETLDKEQLDTLITTLETLIEDAFNVKTVSALGNYLLPEIVDGILNDPNFFVKLPEDINKDVATKMIVEAALNAIKEYPFENVKVVLLDITSSLKLLNDNNVLAPIYNSSKTGTELELGDYVTIIKNTNEDFSEKLSEKITDINLINTLSPTLIDSAFTALFNSLNIDYETNNITAEKANNVLNIVLTNLINGVKTLDITKDYYVTENTFAYAGNILDITKDTSVLTEVQYNSLILKAQEELNKLEAPFELDTISSNLLDVTNWSVEMNKLSLAFNDFATLYAEISGMKTLNVTKVNLSNAGKLFDKLEDTALLNGAVKDVYNFALDYAKTSLNGFDNAFEILKIEENEINWEKELTAIQPLINEMVTFSNKTFTDVESAKQVLTLCEKFDEVEQNVDSIIYSAKMQPLLEEILKVVKNNSNNETINGLITDAQERLDKRTTEALKTCVLKGIFDYSTTLIPNVSEFTDSNIQAMIGEIKTNINNLDNLQNVDYEKELDYMLDFADKINSLQNFENLKNTEITEISSFLDSLSDSSIFNNAKNHIVNFVIDTAISAITNDKLNIISLLEELKETTTVNITTLLEDMNTIKDNVSNLNVDTNDIANLNTTEVATTLENIRNTDTFTDEFTNTIVSNILTNINEDAQNNTLLPSNKKTEINNYVTTQKTNLETEIISTSTYQNILDGLKNLFTV